MEVHRSARRHGVLDEDMEHALVHALSWIELDDDPPRYLLGGPDRAGRLLELVVVDVAGEWMVIHAVALRHSTAEELFGGEQ